MVGTSSKVIGTPGGVIRVGRNPICFPPFSLTSEQRITMSATIDFTRWPSTFGQVISCIVDVIANDIRKSFISLGMWCYKDPSNEDDTFVRILRFDRASSQWTVYFDHALEVSKIIEFPMPEVGGAIVACVPWEVDTLGYYFIVKIRVFCLDRRYVAVLYLRGHLVRDVVSSLIKILRKGYRLVQRNKVICRKNDVITVRFESPENDFWFYESVPFRFLFKEVTANGKPIFIDSKLRSLGPLRRSVWFRLNVMCGDKQNNLIIYRPWVPGKYYQSLQNLPSFDISFSLFQNMFVTSPWRLASEASLEEISIDIKL